MTGLFTQGRTRQLEAGSILFHQGQNPCNLYQLKSGCLKLSWMVSSGKEVIEELLVPGDLFDLPSCLDGRPYPFSAQVVANQDAEVLWIPRQELMADPKLLQACQNQLWCQLREARTHPIASSSERVEVRLTRAILWLASRLGQSASFRLPLSRQELADWVGTTPETAIRILSQLRRRGWLEEERGQVTLLRFTELKACAAAA
jgi:CRP-like cAMP-binding protein